MKMRRGLILLMSVVLFLGCRRIDPTVDLLESELRWMEDQLYLVEDEYERKCSELASCRRENRALRQGDGPEKSGTTIPDAPADDLDEPMDLSPPEVEEGDEIEPNVEFPRPANLPLNINIRPASRVEPCDEPEDTRVTQIVLNRRLTGGVDLDGRLGDEGLMLVIEPRNADGQFVPSPGKVEIAVLDPSKKGNESRVARWSFESVETAPLIRETVFGHGIHMELPWPNQPPESERLHIYVRYTTADGRRIRVDREIQVDPIQEQAGLWTPAARSSAQNGSSAEPTTASTSHSPASSRDDVSVLLADGPSDRVTPVAPEPDSIRTPRSILVSDEPPQGPRTARGRRPEWRPYR